MAKEGISGPVCAGGRDFDGRCEAECLGYGDIVLGICTLDYSFQFDLDYDTHAASDMVDFRARVIQALTNANLNWKRYSRLDIERGSIVVSATGPTKDIRELQDAVENNRVILTTKDGVSAVAAPVSRLTTVTTATTVTTTASSSSTSSQTETVTVTTTTTTTTTTPTTTTSTTSASSSSTRTSTSTSARTSTSSTTTLPIVTTKDREGSSNGGKSSGGDNTAVVGIAIGVALAVLLVLLLIFIVWRRQQRDSGVYEVDEEKKDDIVTDQFEDEVVSGPGSPNKSRVEEGEWDPAGELERGHSWRAPAFASDQFGSPPVAHVSVTGEVTEMGKSGLPPVQPPPPYSEKPPRDVTPPRDERKRQSAAESGETGDHEILPAEPAQSKFGESASQAGKTAEVEKKPIRIPPLETASPARMWSRGSASSLGSSGVNTSTPRRLDYGPETAINMFDELFTDHDNRETSITGLGNDNHSVDSNNADSNRNSVSREVLDSSDPFLGSPIRGAGFLDPFALTPDRDLLKTGDSHA